VVLEPSILMRKPLIPRRSLLPPACRSQHQAIFFRPQPCKIRAYLLSICGILVQVRANFQMSLGIQTQISGDVFIVRCDGRIVFGDEGAALRERVGHMLSGSPRVVVNLEGVDYVDSGGLGILVGLSVSARNRGGELKLVSPTERVSDLLRRTRLDAIISVYGNEEEAVAAFRKQAA
jgi:anti-sigma B factor antagonist